MAWCEEHISHTKCVATWNSGGKISDNANLFFKVKLTLKSSFWTLHIHDRDMILIYFCTWKIPLLESWNISKGPKSTRHSSIKVPRLLLTGHSEKCSKVKLFFFFYVVLSVSFRLKDPCLSAIAFFFLPWLESFNHTGAQYQVCFWMWNARDGQKQRPYLLQRIVLCNMKSLQHQRHLESISFIFPLLKVDFVLFFVRGDVRRVIPVMQYL